MPTYKQSKNKRSVTSLDVVLGNRVRTRRMQMRMPQTELANALGVSFQQIQKYERGTNRIGASRLHQIAEKLEADVAYFMGDIADGKKQPTVSRFDKFMATKDCVDITDAMLRLNASHRKAVIDLARTLSKAYGVEA